MAELPPSLPAKILASATYMSNGELGIRYEDVGIFLNACERDGIGLLGWELWLVDHEWPEDGTSPVYSKGTIHGLVPVEGEKIPAVIGGSGDLAASRMQITKLDLTKEIDPKFRPHIRFNFTLNG